MTEEASPNPRDALVAALMKRADPLRCVSDPGADVPLSPEGFLAAVSIDGFADPNRLTPLERQLILEALIARRVKALDGHLQNLSRKPRGRPKVHADEWRAFRVWFAVHAAPAILDGEGTIDFGQPIRMSIPDALAIAKLFERAMNGGPEGEKIKPLFYTTDKALVDSVRRGRTWLGISDDWVSPTLEKNFWTFPSLVNPG